MVAAVTMGYGHLRAAAAIADQLGVELTEADREPWVEPWELRLWRRSRWMYEQLSRLASTRGLMQVGRPLLDGMTRVAAVDGGGSAGWWAVRFLERHLRRGLGGRLADTLAAEGRALVSTFYAPALAVDRRREVPVACVATDADLHRVWAAADPARSRVLYLAPSTAAEQRLLSYGVPAARVVETGFPLPGGLLGGETLPVLRQDLLERLGRLDRSGRFIRAHRGEVRIHLGAEPLPGGAAPTRLTFAVGGAGAQADAALELLRSVRPLLLEGRLRLALVAGTRPEVARRFAGWVREAGVGDVVEVVGAGDMPTYLSSFNDLLRRTDILWTKPSELVFFAALGLPLLLDRPLGAHEACNRRWLLDRGAALDAPSPRQAGTFLAGHLAGGTLAAVAWQGFLELPSRGLYHTVEVLAREGFTSP